MSTDQVDGDTDEIVAAVKDELTDERFLGDKVLVSRRELVGLAAGSATVAGLLGHGSGTASAQSGSGTGRLGDPTPLEYVGTDLVDAESIAGVVDYIVQSGDDIVSVINNMAAKEVTLVEPGATFQGGQIDVPDEASVIVPGGENLAGQTAVIEKDRNGYHMSVGDKPTLVGIELLGKSASYTGDGLVDRTGTGDFARQGIFKGVSVRDQAGYGRVEDGSYFHTYDACRFFANGAGGLVIQNTNAENTESSQNTYRGRCLISQNNGPGVTVTDGFAHEYVFDDFICHKNAGAAFYINDGTFEAPEVHGNIGSNDGPALLVDGASNGNVKGGVFKGTIKDNNQNPSGTNVDSPSTRTLGDVHVQNTAYCEGLAFDGVNFNVANGSTVVPFSSYSGYAGRGLNVGVEGGFFRGFADAGRVSDSNDKYNYLQPTGLPGTAVGTGGEIVVHDGGSATELVGGTALY